MWLADNTGNGQRPSSSEEAVMKESRLTESRPEEDHAHGLAAMPQSSNAPTSLSMHHSREQASPDTVSSAGSAHVGPGISEQEAGMALVPSGLQQYTAGPLLASCTCYV